MRYTKGIASVSLWGNLLFLIVIVLLNFLRPDKNPLTCFVSEYGIGDYGWLMTTEFFSFATAAVALFSGLLMTIQASKTNIITFSIFCGGAFLFSIFTTDLPEDRPTPYGLIHGFSALLALISLGISMIAWAQAFKKRKGGEKMAMLSRFFRLISLALFIVFFLSPHYLRGFTERILLAWDIDWLLLISSHLFRYR